MELSLSTIERLVFLAYTDWANEFDTLKSVKREVDDGSTDWHLFHAERLRRHTASEAKAKRVLMEAKSMLDAPQEPPTTINC